MRDEARFSLHVDSLSLFPVFIPDILRKVVLHLNDEMFDAVIVMTGFVDGYCNKVLYICDFLDSSTSTKASPVLRLQSILLCEVNTCHYPPPRDNCRLQARDIHELSCKPNA